MKNKIPESILSKRVGDSSDIESTTSSLELVTSLRENYEFGCWTNLVVINFGCTDGLGSSLLLRACPCYFHPMCTINHLNMCIFYSLACVIVCLVTLYVHAGVEREDHVRAWLKMGTIKKTDWNICIFTSCA